MDRTDVYIGEVPIREMLKENVTNTTYYMVVIYTQYRCLFSPLSFINKGCKLFETLFQLKQEEI